MLRRSTSAPADESPADPVETHAGKGHATPSRREREAANRRPLVPSDRKEAARQARAKTQATRERARAGMAAGEERYLTARDRGPQRRYVRDYVDARFSAGELIIPVAVVFILLSFVPNPAIATYGVIVLWVFFGVAVIDSLVLGFLVRKRIGAKFGVDNVERGLRWYAAMRAFQLRVIRLPKPQVKRGQWPS